MKYRFLLRTSFLSAGLLCAMGGFSSFAVDAWATPKYTENKTPSRTADGYMTKYAEDLKDFYKALDAFAQRLKSKPLAVADPKQKPSLQDEYDAVKKSIEGSFDDTFSLPDATYPNKRELAYNKVRLLKELHTKYDAIAKATGVDLVE